MKQPPETIYLIPGEDIDGQLGWLWCDDPAPGEGMDPAEAVKYVRAGSARAIERDVAFRQRDLTYKQRDEAELKWPQVRQENRDLNERIEELESVNRAMEYNISEKDKLLTKIILENAELEKALKTDLKRVLNLKNMVPGQAGLWNVWAQDIYIAIDRAERSNTHV